MCGVVDRLYTRWGDRPDGFNGFNLAPLMLKTLRSFLSWFNTIWRGWTAWCQGWLAPFTRRIAQHRNARVLSRGLLLLICIGLGWSISQLWQGVGAQNVSPTEASPEPSIVTTTDPIPPRYELGHELYLENCATCHIGVPPAVLPQQSWLTLLQDTQHYGVTLPPLVDPPRLLIWQYVQRFSRSLNEGEDTPYRLRNSRLFKALHPRVEFESPVRLNGCVSCHPGAPEFNYRRLTPEWEDAP